MFRLQKRTKHNLETSGAVGMPFLHALTYVRGVTGVAPGGHPKDLQIEVESEAPPRHFVS